MLPPRLWARHFATRNEILMSAKITVIVYILICFELGILLLILPWSPFWNDNFFLYFITGKLNAPGLITFLKHPAVRGAVTGLGVINILAGLHDLFRFRESVGALLALNEPSVIRQERAVEPATPSAPALPDQQPPRIPPQP